MPLTPSKYVIIDMKRHLLARTFGRLRFRQVHSKDAPSGAFLLVLVVVAALQEFDPVGFDQVDTAMLLRNTPGPDIRTQIFQWFGLADAIEGVAQDSLYQLQQPLGGATVRLNPVLQVL